MKITECKSIKENPANFTSHAPSINDLIKIPINIEFSKFLNALKTKKTNPITANMSKYWFNVF